MVGEGGHAQVVGIRVNRTLVGMTEGLFKSNIRGVTPAAGIELGHST